jgi:hypothetical protein
VASRERKDWADQSEEATSCPGAFLFSAFYILHSTFFIQAASHGKKDSPERPDYSGLSGL